MKNILRLTVEDDNSEIHKEYHKSKMGKGKLKKKAYVENDGKEIKIKLKPKCLK